MRPLPSRHSQIPLVQCRFVSVTGANSEAASFFLDSAKGDVQAAIDQYFTSGGDMDIPQDMPGAASAPPAQQTPGPAAQQQPAALALPAPRKVRHLRMHPPAEDTVRYGDFSSPALNLKHCHPLACKC